ncbi:MAG: alpha/beta fold hydrolase, partial [Chloroflexota bacterium]|nr:alpha/beta fold hydrolase [Chloroflexota bacterium]
MLSPMKHLRRPSLKQILLSGIGGSVGIMGVLFAVALYIVETLIRPGKRSIFDGYTFSPYELELPGEAVTFSSLHGDHQVSGWYIPHEGATTTILVCPGYRSHKSDGLGIGAFLWRAGHNVLLFDYYGHGAPVGKPVTLGYREINDFLGAVAYAKERAPQTRLGAIGYSMGAAIAIMATAREPAIEALVADSAFATHLSAVNYNVRRTIRMPSTPFVWLADYLLWVRAGYRFHQVEPIRDVSHIAPRPILIIHGGKDSMVDPQDAPLLYAAAKEPKELWQLPDADHCGAYFVDRIAYTQRINNFFNEHLRKPRLQLLESSGDAQSAHPGNEAG